MMPNFLSLDGTPCLMRNVLAMIAAPRVKTRAMQEKLLSAVAGAGGKWSCGKFHSLNGRAISRCTNGAGKPFFQPTGNQWRGIRTRWQALAVVRT